MRHAKHLFPAFLVTSVFSGCVFNQGERSPAAQAGSIAIQILADIESGGELDQAILDQLPAVIGTAFANYLRDSRGLQPHQVAAVEHQARKMAEDVKTSIEEALKLKDRDKKVIALGLALVPIFVGIEIPEPVDR